MNTGDWVIYGIIGVLAILYFISLIGEKILYKNKP